VTPGTPPKPWFELKTFSQLQHRDVRNVFIGILAKYLSQEKNVVENFFACHLAAKSTHENLLSFEGSRKAAVRFESGQVAQTPLNQKKTPDCVCSERLCSARRLRCLQLSQRATIMPVCTGVDVCKITVTSDRTVCFA
jgi:hypothetical protein